MDGLQIVVVKRPNLPARPAPAGADPKKSYVAPPMTIDQIASAVAVLKERARRLRPPLNQDPERWHIDKSELTRDLELLEDAVRKGLPCPERLR
jgi:hypothetical protein